MVTVIRNANGTYTVTLTPRGEQILLRWATEQSRNRANQLEEVIKGFMQNKAQDYRQIDGPTMRDRYEALTPEQQAQVNTILNG